MYWFSIFYLLYQFKLKQFLIRLNHIYFDSLTKFRRLFVFQSYFSLIAVAFHSYFVVFRSNFGRITVSLQSIFGRIYSIIVAFWSYFCCISITFRSHFSNVAVVFQPCCRRALVSFRSYFSLIWVVFQTYFSRFSVLFQSHFSCVYEIWLNVVLLLCHHWIKKKTWNRSYHWNWGIKISSSLLSKKGKYLNSLN